MKFEQENPRIVAIVEARMTSSRLPGKHLLKANGKPMIQHLIERLQSISIIEEIVVATTMNDADDILVEYVRGIGASVYRGSEYDVMGRVLEAGELFNADVICEVTGDCPVIDPQLIEHLIRTFLVNDVEYASNGRHGLPDGMGAQVFMWEALRKSAEMTQEPLHREHVTLHMKQNPDLFRALYLVAPKQISWPELGLTLDEFDDYLLLKKIIEFYVDTDGRFSCEDVINLLKINRNWLKINQHVFRKGDS